MSGKPVITEALASIFSGIRQLKDAFPEKEFTIDGRLVGDIGEVIAAQEYDIELYYPTVKGYDGRTSDGRQVQIKATFKSSLTFRSTPDYYLGFKLYEDGSHKEIYNGPGQPIHDHYAHRKGIGEELLSFPIRKLRELSAEIPPTDRIPKRVRENAYR